MISTIFEFVPLVIAVSLVCASMKEDEIPAILWKGARFAATLTGFTVAFILFVQLLMSLFL